MAVSGPGRTTGVPARIRRRRRNSTPRPFGVAADSALPLASPAQMSSSGATRPPVPYVRPPSDRIDRPLLLPSHCRIREASPGAGSLGRTRAAWEIALHAWSWPALRIAGEHKVVALVGLEDDDRMVTWHGANRTPIHHSP